MHTQFYRFRTRELQHKFHDDAILDPSSPRLSIVVVTFAQTVLCAATSSGVALCTRATALAVSVRVYWRDEATLCGWLPAERAFFTHRSTDSI